MAQHGKGTPEEEQQNLEMRCKPQGRVDSPQEAAHTRQRDAKNLWTAVRIVKPVVSIFLGRRLPTPMSAHWKTAFFSWERAVTTHGTKRVACFAAAGTL